MCGIVGIYNRENSSAIRREVLEKMTNAIVHRGPDDAGFYTDDAIGFGFRRLAIIDLHSGNQPMFNEDLTISLVCNGEIFNYKTLRAELVLKGHKFRTECDVEVLVHLYEEYGTGMMNKLNGQFAFAIYDKKQQQLLLARDHVGIVPLFYWRRGDELVFASEIKAILQYPGVARKVNLRGLDQVLSFPGNVSPTTMFDGISSLKPGHFLLIKKDHFSITSYWDLDYPCESDEAILKPESYYIEQLDELLTRSVRYRLQADVDVGFYLSGGLDSSLIAALAHELFPGKKRNSFSIAFNERDIDERRYQQMMASRLGNDHHELIFESRDISGKLRDAIYYAEAPLRETYNTCSLLLSESVRNANIKVILTGEGADELFCGYIGYKFDNQRQAMSSELMGYEEAMEQEIRHAIWGDENFQYENNLFPFTDIKRALYSKELNELFSQFDSVKEGIVDKNKLIGRNKMHKRSYLDFKLRLADHLLADHGDRVAYANSIEARYPFLDVDVIEFVKTIPPCMKVKGMKEKYILKRLAEKYVPREIIGREKFGFVAPASPFLLRNNVQWVNDILSYDTIKRQGYFNPDTIERLKKTYLQDNFYLRPTFENDLLITVITFGLFIEIFETSGFVA